MRAKVRPMPGRIATTAHCLYPLASARIIKKRAARLVFNYFRQILLQKYCIFKPLPERWFGLVAFGLHGVLVGLFADFYAQHARFAIHV